MVARRLDRRRITVKDYWKWPKLSIDRKVMEQIFTNLLINSIKYAFDEPESFAIDISMERTSDGNYEIIVSDYGIGIEQDAGNRIFLPGERGERAINKLPTRNRNWTYNCKESAEYSRNVNRIGKFLNANDLLHKGPKTSYRRGIVMILFVDDEPKYVAAYTQAFELSQFEVKMVPAVDEAWQILESQKEDVDAIILDVMMPHGKLFDVRETQDGLRTGLLFVEVGAI